MTSSFLGGIVTPPPPLPLVIICHFLATPPHRASNSRHNRFRDKTAYVGFLSIVEGPSQPVAAMSITILSFDTYIHTYIQKKKWGCNNRWLKMVIES